MGMEPDFSELDESLKRFLDALNKCTISDVKKIEIEKKLLEALLMNDEKNNNRYPKPSVPENINYINLNKLSEKTSKLRSPHIKQKAINWASGLAYFSAGLLFITIGFILIVTPTSPEFEIATIIYFNDHDGLTVMDLFALMIIFMGIYLFIRAFIDSSNRN